MPRPLTTLDLDLLRTFSAIAGLGSFTRAAEQLHRQQSTISLQLQRLEGMLGRPLFERSPRAVRLTAAGESLLGPARQLLQMNDELVALICEPQMQGVIRLGTPEDFATRHLPALLARFARAHPAIELQVTCDLTLNLLDQFQAGALDLALVKRERASTGGGIRVWREPLVWVMSDRRRADSDQPLPLVVSPAPCVYRQRAIDALQRRHRSWRVAYTCASLAGSLAAVREGLGVTVLPKDMVPEDLHIQDGPEWPDLKDTEIALLQRPGLSEPAQRLRDHVIRSLS
jgi:DNA-binding transcriptional LysR family regulator